MTDYFDPSGAPATSSQGSSATIRAEFTSIQTGLSNKLPPLTGNGDEIVKINTAGSAIESVAQVAVAQGGTGASTLTDGGILLGSGTGAITATAALADGEMLVGDGTTDPAIESGATLRASIGVAIGTDVQAYDATLASIAGLGTAADKYAYTTGVDTWAEGSITTAGRALLDDATAADQLVTLGITATATELDYTNVAAIGTAEASKALVLDGSKDISGINSLSAESAELLSTDAGASGGPGFDLYRNSASPAPSDAIGVIRFYGEDSVSTKTLYGHIRGQIIDETDSAEDGQVIFATIGGGVFNDRMKVARGITIGAATDGDKGPGTLNAEGVYDDGVLLTCYVFDAALDGSISNAKWDVKVPGGDHAPMKKFKSRMGTSTDPLDIDAYANHWKTKRHLTSMPNEEGFTHGDMSNGEWTQRLIETVEIQAVHIENLNQRLKEQDARITALESA
jgi:hypothetical protein